MEEEICIDIVGFEGLYQATSTGKIKTLVNRYKLVNYLIPGISHNGYEQVMLVKNKKRFTRRVSRLIAKAFVPNPLNLPCVNHKDTNKRNNKPNNLEWCTIPQNNAHAKANGLILTGFDHPRRKYSNELIAEIRKKFNPYNYSVFQLMNEYHLSKGAIYHILDIRYHPELGIPLNKFKNNIHKKVA